MLSQAQISTLTQIVGPDGVRLGADMPDRHQADRAALPPLRPSAVVYPRNAKDVSRILAACGQLQLPVVVQGGLTGLAGGGHPQDGEIALSTERLRGPIEIDVVGRTMTVSAGTTLQEVHDAALAEGLFFGVDLGARGSCTIGGMAATNAGGIQVLRYGMMRQNIRGAEAVLPDGTILSALNGLAKNNTGYDWKEMLVGAEGTLGIFTRLVLVLRSIPAPMQTAFCATANEADAQALLHHLDEAFPGRLTTFEAMWPDYMKQAERIVGTPNPLGRSGAVCVIAEVALGDDDAARIAFEGALAGAMEQGLVQDALIAQSGAQRAGFWAWREAVYEFGRILPVVAQFDISLPAEQIGPGIALLRDRLKDDLDGAELIVFGHLGDCNLHLDVVPGSCPTGLTGVNDVVYAVVRQMNGSISAEHGIGVLKRPYLSMSRSKDEMAFGARLKSFMDPAHILNRNRVYRIAD